MKLASRIFLVLAYIAPSFVFALPRIEQPQRIFFESERVRVELDAGGTVWAIAQTEPTVEETRLRLSSKGGVRDLYLSRGHLYAWGRDGAVKGINLSLMQIYLQRIQDAAVMGIVAGGALAITFRQNFGIFYSESLLITGLSLFWGWMYRSNDYFFRGWSDGKDLFTVPVAQDVLAVEQGARTGDLLFSFAEGPMAELSRIVRTRDGRHCEIFLTRLFERLP